MNEPRRRQHQRRLGSRASLDGGRNDGHASRQLESGDLGDLGERERGWGVSLVPVAGLPEGAGEAWLLAVKAVKCRLFELITPAGEASEASEAPDRFLI